VTRKVNAEEEGWRWWKRVKEEEERRVDVLRNKAREGRRDGDGGG